MASLERNELVISALDPQAILTLRFSKLILNILLSFKYFYRAFDEIDIQMELIFFVQWCTQRKNDFYYEPFDTRLIIKKVLHNVFSLLVSDKQSGFEFVFKLIIEKLCHH